MMVRPLNAAKPATTSRRSALSHVTVMRAACDCALSDAWATRYASTLEPSPLCAGVATRAAWPPRPAARCATGGTTAAGSALAARSEEHTSELQSPDHLVCRLLLEKKKNKTTPLTRPYKHACNTTILTILY